MGFWRTNAATRFWTSGDAEACSHDESVVPLFMCVAVMCAHKSCFFIVWSMVSFLINSFQTSDKQISRAVFRP